MRNEYTMRWLLIAVHALVATPLAAATISSPGTFTPTQAIVDFEAFAPGTLGPITVGDMTVSGAIAQRVNGQGFTQFPGIFEGNYFGFAGTDYTIAFAVDVTHVGFGLFDPNSPDIDIQALDRGGNVLESFSPPTGPTGGSFSTYVGFARTIGDIASVRVLQPRGFDLLAVDSIAWRVASATPPVSEVPLPAAGWLLLGGLAALAGARCRRKA